MEKKGLPRREFMKGALASGAGLTLATSSHTAKAQEPAAPEKPQKVPRKMLGKTGVSIPILLMGCCQTLDPKYDKRLHRAYQFGVDFLDTAQMYAGGKSHQTIAPFIKQIGDRKKLFIASKVHMAPHAATPDKFRSNLDKCLADLETDYLDLFYMHMAHDKAYLTPEILKMAEELKKEGKIRFFGFTAHDAVPEMLQAGAALGGGIDAIMFRYNFRQYGDKELNMAMDACKKAGIGLIAMKTLGSIPDDAEEALKFKSDEFTLTQAKLKAVWADERIDAVCSQMSSVEHVMENTAAAMSPVKLSMTDFVQLNRFAARTSPQYCTGCSHLCESKVDCNLRIADTLRYLMYHDAYGEKESARQLYSALADCERDFSGIDLAAATAACPQGINIANRLLQAQRTLSA